MIGWAVRPIGLLWLGIPVVTAILLSQKGGRRYLDEDGPRVTRPNLIVFAIFAFVGAIGWVIAVIFVLLNEKYPENLWRFLCGLVRREVPVRLPRLSRRAPPSVHARDKHPVSCHARTLAAPAR